MGDCVDLAFEIRDLKYDIRALGTIPQRLGVKTSKYVGTFLLVLVVLLEVFKPDGLKYLQIGQYVMILVSALFYGNQNGNNHLILHPFGWSLCQLWGCYLCGVKGLFLHFRRNFSLRAFYPGRTWFSSLLLMVCVSFWLLAVYSPQALQ